ncbi:MAG: redox-sensing transcriptional repressor Rex [Pseudonocardiaceae bacterium]
MTTQQHADGVLAAARRDIPTATVSRLPLYLRTLHDLAGASQLSVSSKELASAAGVNPAQLRKDLSYLGSHGTRGVGYDVTNLIGQISFVLGLGRDWSVVMVGAGHLGRALAGYSGLGSRGFRIAAVADADPGLIGASFAGLTVQGMEALPAIVAESNVEIGIIATPAHASQQVCDQLVAAGVTGSLNFAPCLLSVPDGVEVRKVDFAMELQILSFHEHRRRSGELPAIPSNQLEVLESTAGVTS